jgi:hypothetical protein
MGGKGSGGYREKASQNNPMNISATGGNGQSGKNYTGFGYSKNKEINDQKGGARMQGPVAPPIMPTIASGTPTSVTPTGTPSRLMSMSSLEELEPTGLPTSDGVDVGRGRGSEALPNNINPDFRPMENAELIAKYLPDLINAARVENAPDSYKRLVNKLKGMI